MANVFGNDGVAAVGGVAVDTIAQTVSQFAIDPSSSGLNVTIAGGNLADALGVITQIAGATFAIPANTSSYICYTPLNTLVLEAAISVGNFALWQITAGATGIASVVDMRYNFSQVPTVAGFLTKGAMDYFSAPIAANAGLAAASALAAGVSETNSAASAAAALVSETNSAASEVAAANSAAAAAGVVVDISTGWGGVIAASATKDTVLVSNDKFAILDSESGNIVRGLTASALRASLAVDSTYPVSNRFVTEFSFQSLTISQPAWYKIADMPVSSGSTGDQLLLECWFSSSTATLREKLTCIMGQRNGFSAKTLDSLRFGTGTLLATTLGIEAYTNADGMTSVYAYLPAASRSMLIFAASVGFAAQAEFVHPTLTVAETVMPTGTLVYDSKTDYLNAPMRLPVHTHYEINARAIKFPAAAVANADASTLDDYEEGTWTPTFTFGTVGDLAIAYTTQLGTYTKIGRKVTATFNIVTSSFTHTTAASSARITRLPFTSAAAFASIGSLNFGGITSAGNTQFVTAVANSVTYCLIYASASEVAPIILSASAFPTGGNVILRGTVTYEV